MPDTLPPELVGKGKRVAGVFVFMIGASIILDTHALWMGLPMLAVGAALFAWGMADAPHHRAPRGAAARRAPREPQP